MQQRSAWVPNGNTASSQMPQGKSLDKRIGHPLALLLPHAAQFETSQDEINVPAIPDRCVFEDAGGPVSETPKSP